MRKAVLKSVTKYTLISLCASITLSSVVWADSTDTIVQSGLNRQKSAQQSQTRIDKIFDETEKVIAKYHREKKVVDGLKVYNNRMRRTLEAQRVAMNQLEISIDNASNIERQIVPLMMQMITGLDQFIEADIPFKLEERKERVARIKSYLTNANISAAERFRKVLEAYSIENSYGQTIDVYFDTINIEGQDLSVNVLQLGRTAMYCLTTNGKISAIYDQTNRSWQLLDGKHNEGISRAILVAQKKVSPELMLLPVPAPKEIL